MNKTHISILLLLLTGMVMNVASDTGIIIDKNLYNRSPSVRASLNQYINDLKNIEHRTVALDDTSFDSSSNPKDIRTTIYNYKKGHPLDGVVFIGKIPWLYHVYQTESKSYDTVATDYYYMDLNNANPDSCWNVTVAPNGKRIIEKKCNHNLSIWVSRILSPYGTYNYKPLYHSDNLGPSWNPDTIINRYLIKVHKRMTEPATVPRRALFTGFVDNPSEMAQFPSSYPIVHYLYPSSSAHNWMRELRKGYEFASLHEHSCWEHSNFGQNWKPYGTGTFCGYEPSNNNIKPPFRIENSNGQFATMDKMDTINYPPPFGGGPSHTLFFSDEGCNNVDFSKERCLGLMYGMMFDGLICMGATTLESGDNGRTPFVQALLNDSTFGAAYLGHVNRYKDLIYTLIGAGTLKMAPYVNNQLPVFPIDPAAITITPDNPILTEGDSVTLSASGSFGHIPPSSFRWYGNRDSAIGNPARFRIEGQYPGDMCFTVHLNQQGIQPSSAVATIPFPWDYTSSRIPGDTVGWSRVSHDLSYDAWALCYSHNDPTWSTTLIANCGKNKLDMDSAKYIHYHAPMPLNDDFEISTLVTGIYGDYPVGPDPEYPYNDPNWNGCVGTGFRPGQIVMAGVMAREHQIDNDRRLPDGAYAFFGSELDYSGYLKLVFIYRTAEGGPVTVHSEGLWSFWCLGYINYKISRLDNKLYVKATVPCYGYDDNNPIFSDSVDLGPNTRELFAGPAFFNGGCDTSVHSEYGARFTNIKTKVIPTIPLELRLISLGLDSVLHLNKAVFGCTNRNYFNVTVPVGDSNKVYCGDDPNGPPINVTQRSVFPPGSSTSTLYFSCTKITWLLKNNSPVVADMGRMPYIPLELRLVSMAVDSLHSYNKAIFECVNRNNFNITLPVGENNKVYCGDDPNMPNNNIAHRSVFPPGSTRDTFSLFCSKITWVLESNPPVVAGFGRLPPLRSLLPATNVFWLFAGFISTAFLGVGLIRRREKRGK